LRIWDKLICSRTNARECAESNIMEHKKVREDRGKKYGDIKQNHKNIGESWHSILCSYYQQDLPPLPPHVVCLMFAVFKMVRAAIPFTHSKDDYLDMRNYSDFAEELDAENHK